MIERRRPALVGIVLLATGCGGGEPASRAAAPAAARPIVFTDVTEAAGVRFVHDNGASSERYLPETMGSGVAIFDADGDGWPEIYFASSLAVARLDAPPAGAATGALYRNRGRGDGRGDGPPDVTFEDVTAASGLGRPFLGMGTAVGDVDNDGDLDLLVTGVGGERLYLNRGDGVFDDASAAWGLASEGFGSSAAFADIDGDGWLDLFAGRYVAWSPEGDLRCTPDGEHRSYCTPEAYRGARNLLYRNRGGRRFEEVGAEAGVGVLEGKTLGVAVLDLDGDLDPDLAVANDTTRNFLYRNRGDGTFDEVGLEAGIALGHSGAPRGAMGIDAGDLDGDGDPDLVIGNFAQEMGAVYRQRRGGTFADDAPALGVGLPTLMTLAFGALAADLDGDGWLDLVFANGHIEPDIARFQPLQSYAQPLAVFRNLGGRSFAAVEPGDGDALARPLVGRGLAAGDLDGDGDPDLVITQNGGPARVLRNDAPGGRYLRLRLAGRSSNRTGFGARVEVEAGGRTIRRWLTSGRSYLSACEPVVTVGLGPAARVDAVRVVWPSGIVQELGALELERTHRVVEPRRTSVTGARCSPSEPSP